jgi:hypothetical protein
MRLFVQS